MTALCVTVDVDQDGIALGSERTSLSWNAVSMVPRLAELFERHGVRATWFVRADNQLSEVYGSAAYLLEHFSTHWRALRGAGHLIAWHPHVYRREREWVPETDPQRCAEQLERIHAELRGHVLPAVRMGEAFHSNATMHTLDRLGVRIDSTAIPGRKRNDGERCFDWEPTTNAPYHPSRGDYRVPGTDALSILEVPMTSIPIRAPYDEAPLRRYMNLAYRAELLADAELDGLPTIVTIVHPEEAMVRPENPLYGDGLEEVERNLRALLARGVTVKTMDELI